MNDDETFAANLRPDSVFGALGESDHFDDDVEEFGEMADGWDGSEPVEDTVFSNDQTAYSAPRQAAPAATAPARVKPQAGSASAGFGLLWLAAGGLLGWHFGKAKGAAGGALAAAGVRNLYRAQRDMRNPNVQVRADAVRPGLIGLVGTGAGSYLLYDATK